MLFIGTHGKSLAPLKHCTMHIAHNGISVEFLVLNRLKEESFVLFSKKKILFCLIRVCSVRCTCSSEFVFFMDIHGSHGITVIQCEMWKEIWTLSWYVYQSIYECNVFGACEFLIFTVRYEVYALYPATVLYGLPFEHFSLSLF